MSSNAHRASESTAMESTIRDDHVSSLGLAVMQFSTGDLAGLEKIRV